MTNLNLLGSEQSANQKTKFVGTEHLFDLGMVYKGCIDGSLSVIKIDCEDDILSTVASTLSAVVLSNQSDGSKIQILFDPVDIELAYIKLSLKLKASENEAANKGERKSKKNVEIVDGVPFDINNADKVTLIIALTECSEAIMNKIISQANEGNVSIYVITNNKSVAESFVMEDVDDSTLEDNYIVTPKVEEAIRNQDFSNLTKEEALECPQLFREINNEGKDYVALTISGKSDEIVFFDVTPEGKLKMIVAPGVSSK